MKFTQMLAPVAGLVAVANAWGNETSAEGTTTVTTITTDYETYCPGPTTFIHKNATYTATEETTLTITNCPCTITTKEHPPVTTTSEDSTGVVTYTETGVTETVVEDCTPIGEDGKPTPTGEAPPSEGGDDHDEDGYEPGEPGKPGEPGEPGEEPPTSPGEDTPQESGPVEAGADKVGSGFGFAAVAGLFAFML